mmetsp:Transcript_26306/g.51264  ORF Transcript_26306/g.51264 Transcript_26306/m.51264 type:complete len:241 (+) Transcript_26306:623-1345(+)
MPGATSSPTSSRSSVSGWHRRSRTRRQRLAPRRRRTGPRPSPQRSIARQQKTRGTRPRAAWLPAALVRSLPWARGTLPGWTSSRGGTAWRCRATRSRRGWRRSAAVPLPCSAVSVSRGAPRARASAGLRPRGGTRRPPRRRRAPRGARARTWTTCTASLMTRRRTSTPGRGSSQGSQRQETVTSRLLTARLSRGWRTRGAGTWRRTGGTTPRWHAPATWCTWEGRTRGRCWPGRRGWRTD